MRIDLTRSKTYEVAYPYDGNALDTSNILREHYWPHRDIDFLKKNQRKMNSLYMVEGVIGAVGGAIFVQTNKYLQDWFFRTGRNRNSSMCNQPCGVAY